MASSWKSRRSGLIGGIESSSKWPRWGGAKLYLNKLYSNESATVPKCEKLTFTVEPGTA